MRVVEPKEEKVDGESWRWKETGKTTIHKNEKPEEDLFE